MYVKVLITKYQTELFRTFVGRFRKRPFAFVQFNFGCALFHFPLSFSLSLSLSHFHWQVEVVCALIPTIELRTNRGPMQAKRAIAVRTASCHGPPITSLSLSLSLSPTCSHRAWAFDYRSTLICAFCPCPAQPFFVDWRYGRPLPTLSPVPSRRSTDRHTPTSSTICSSCARFITRT
jgi:hypothetical protein